VATDAITLLSGESFYVFEEGLFPADREIDVAEWFTEDFKLHDPSIAGVRSGHDGARDMLRSLAEHVPRARIDVLDMLAEGNKVAVRWLFSGKKEGRQARLFVGSSDLPLRWGPHCRGLGNCG
jgi:SnoaL-like domain